MGDDGNVKRVRTPFTDEAISALAVGNVVRITGTIYTARDAAHQRLIEMLEAGEPMPFEFGGQAVYYAGPSPTRPGMIVGSIGPTTSGRMDAYSPELIRRGLKVMIGKGLRGEEVRRAIAEHRGVYLVAIGGAAALISRSVRGVEPVAFDDLGPEAIRMLRVEDFPAIVAIDSRGNNIYRQRGAEKELASRSGNDF